MGSIHQITFTTSNILQGFGFIMLMTGLNGIDAHGPEGPIISLSGGQQCKYASVEASFVLKAGKTWTRYLNR